MTRLLSVLGRLWAARGYPTPDNDRSPRHLNWPDPRASSGTLIGGTVDQ
jgi:hypothetical protein